LKTRLPYGIKLGISVSVDFLSVPDRQTPTRTRTEPTRGYGSDTGIPAGTGRPIDH